MKVVYKYKKVKLLTFFTLASVYPKFSLPLLTILVSQFSSRRVIRGNQVKILNRPAAVSSTNNLRTILNPLFSQMNGKDVSKMEQVRRPAKIYSFEAFEE